MRSKHWLYQSPAGEDGDAGGGNDSVGTGNDARIALLNQIADSADVGREDELADVHDDDTTTPFKANKDLTVEDDEPAPEPEAATAEPDPEPVSKTLKLKVNGKEVELTEQQAIERLQKIEAADEYLRQAAEVKKAATKLVGPPVPVTPSPEELQRRADEEDRALVRAIQMGTEEEAAAALRKLREQSSARPSLSRDDVSRTIDDRLAFNTAIDQFSKDYKDVWTDPVLKKLALDRDTALLAEGDDRPYLERYTAIGSEIRSWKESLVGASRKEEPLVADLSEKEARKASAPKVPVAASAKTKPPAQEEEVDDSPTSVIQAMAKQRGGPQWMRS